MTRFLEDRMDASFGTTPLAMARAIRLMENSMVNTEEIISHRMPLTEIGKAFEIMSGGDRNKIVINP